MIFRTAPTLSRFTPFRSPSDADFAEIDIELLTFIERYATNLTRWDLLAFFGQNPSASGNASEIAQRIGRGSRVTQKELDDLAYLGVLRAFQNGKGLLYELACPPETRCIVERFARHLSPDQAPIPYVKNA